MALPESYQIREYREALALLDYLKERVERGEVMSILAVCEDTDGTMSGSCTATQNTYAVFGYLLSWAMIRMGFVQDEKLKKIAEE